MLCLGRVHNIKSTQSSWIGSDRSLLAMLGFISVRPSNMFLLVTYMYLCLSLIMDICKHCLNRTHHHGAVPMRVLKCCSTSMACITCPSAPTPPTTYTPCPSSSPPTSTFESIPGQGGSGLANQRAGERGAANRRAALLTLPCSWQDGRRPVGEPCFGVWWWSAALPHLRTEPASSFWLPEWIFAYWLEHLAVIWFTNPPIVDCGMNSQVKREHRPDFWKSLGIQIWFCYSALTQSLRKAI